MHDTLIKNVSAHCPEDKHQIAKVVDWIFRASLAWRWASYPCFYGCVIFFCVRRKGETGFVLELTSLLSRILSQSTAAQDFICMMICMVKMMSLLFGLIRRWWMTTLLLRFLGFNIKDHLVWARWGVFYIYNSMLPYLRFIRLIDR
jgi:hypothetical protein